MSSLPGPVLTGSRPSLIVLKTGASASAVPPAGQPPATTTAGVAGSPENADLISVAPAGGAFVQPEAAPGIGGNSLFLITDAGVKYPVPSASAAQALGYPAGRAVALPAGLLGLLPTGPALNLAPIKGGS